MLTLVLLLFLPAVLALSLYRLVQLPRDLIAGRKWLNPKRRATSACASLLVYGALGAYTACVLAALAGLILRVPRGLDAILSAASLLAGYPFIYLAYGWVCHYAFDPRPKRQ
jgi:hypothetical protein